MAIKILENNAVDITNIDGAAFNNFSSGNRDGIVGGWANECIVSATGNNVLISTGLLILRGVRLKITEIESITLSSTPSADTRYQIIAQITKAGEAFTPTLFVQVPISLIQDDIINSEGVYQIELGRFTHTALGTITDVVRTADVLYGGASVTADVDVGDVTTDILAPGLDAEIDIDKRVEGKKTVFDFHFSLPATAGTAVLVDDVEQSSIAFTGDPQAQINSKVDKEAGKGLSTNDYDNTEKAANTANTNARHSHTNKAILDATTASFTAAQESKLAGALTLATARNYFYPVGSYYMSRNNTSPAGIMGGTWTKITNDAYLKIISSGTGGTGGTASDHKIPIGSMPSHNHTFDGVSGEGTTYDRIGNVRGANAVTRAVDDAGGGNPYYPYYYGVHVWYRTA